jgi:hypothetical protein
MFTFNYSASGSSNNFLGIGLYAYYDRFKLYNNKAIFEDRVTLNNGTIMSASETVSKVNPYIPCNTANGTRTYWGETMSCVIYDMVAWSYGGTYGSGTGWFQKVTDNSCLTFIGSCTAYSSVAGQNCYYRITWSNLTDGTSYVNEFQFYFNLSFQHTTMPFGGVVSTTGNVGTGTFPTKGYYSVSFVRLNANLQSDSGDSICCHIMLTSNFLGK